MYLFLSGRFGFLQLNNNEKRSYQLKTASGGMNGVGQQCLVYYYYMGAASTKSITINKVEMSGSSQIIGSVTSSPFNGWIERKISFNADANVQRTAGFQAPTIGFDEISIRQGSCEDEPITVGPTAGTSTSIQTTTTTMPIETTTATEAPVETTTPVPLTTTTTTIPLETTTTTTTPEPVVTTTRMLTQTTSTTQPTTVMITTTTTSFTSISTAQTSSSPATTNTFTPSIMYSSPTTQISMETGNTVTISSTVPITTTPLTAITSMESTTNPNDDNASRKNLIIVLATVLPAVLIGAIGVTFGIKMFLSKGKVSANPIELNTVPPTIS
ncbi:unnamed protein product [Rotaria sp. Silwood1]|nr:unnamed protein product [Rotaria sp. Silwood1]